MKSPVKEHPAGVWFADRIDDQRTRRNLFRWYAVGFNGLFLSFFDIERVGTILFTVAAFVVGQRHLTRLDRMRPLTSTLDSPAAIRHEPVRMEIYRDGVLLGADEGWLGRRNGALAYEGRRTRFEIVVTDLEQVPRFTTVWDPARLRVKREYGWVEVEFRPWNADDASRTRIQEILTKWPWTLRRLAGPPSLPNSHRPHGFLFARSFDKMVLPVMLAILGIIAFASRQQLSDLVAYEICIASLALAGGWIFQQIYRRDQKAMALLAAIDQELPLADAQAPAEPQAPEVVVTTVR